MRRCGQPGCSVALVSVEAFVIDVSGRTQVDSERRKPESEVVYQSRVHPRRRERPGAGHHARAQRLELLPVRRVDDDLLADDLGGHELASSRRNRRNSLACLRSAPLFHTLFLPLGCGMRATSAQSKWSHV